MIRKFDKLEPAIRSMKREYKKENGGTLTIGPFDHAVLEHCINTKTPAHFKVPTVGAILVFWSKELPCGGEQLEVVYEFNQYSGRTGSFRLQTRGYWNRCYLTDNINVTEANIDKIIAKLIRKGERVAKALNLTKPGFPESVMDHIPTNKGA